MEGGLWLPLLAGAGVALWAWMSAARETVDRISREVCEDLTLQRLDESVTLGRMRLRRTAGGIGIERVFYFEFSTTGVDRRRGDVCLLGSRPQWVRVHHPEGVIHIDIASPPHGVSNGWH